MGMPNAQVQPGTQPQGKGFSNRMAPMPTSQPDAQATTQIMAGLSNKMLVKQTPTFQQPQMDNLAVEPDNFATPAVEPTKFAQGSAGRGKGNLSTYSPTSGQPTFGQPNRYPNTVGQWDNANIQRTNQQPMGGGKGKG